MKARGGGRRGREGQAVGGEASFEGWPVSDEFTAGGGWMEVVGIEEDWVNSMGWVARWPASKAGTDGYGLDMGGEEAENDVWCVCG